MTRKRGTALRAALIASLAVAFGVGSSALATTPPSEPAGGGGECPRDVAAAEAAATTAPETTAAPATTAAAAAPATTAGAAPETTAAAPVETAPSPTLPANVSELDSEKTSDINPQPRDSLQQGGTLRLTVSSLPALWNGAHIDGTGADLQDIIQPMTYIPWLADSEAQFTPNPDFIAGFEASEDLLTLTYQLNPDAVWNSGEPITVADWQAMWNAMNGLNPEFLVFSTEGYNLITSVEQGADEFEVVVSFCEPYPDFERLFFLAGPAATIADPVAFNEGWVGEPNNDWFTGPFEIGAVDTAAQIVQLVPNDTWWGAAPLLDTIEFRIIDDVAAPQAFANNEIDSFDIGPNPNGYALAFNTPGAEIRAAAGPNWRHVTFNSGPNGGLIQDQVIRQAIQMSLDRAAIGVSDLAGIPWPAKPLGNHLLVENSQYYVDNSGEFGTYDPDGAMALLEENGWVVGDDGVREKDGQRLTVRFTQILDTPVSQNEAQLIRAQLAEVGIEVEIVDITADEFFGGYLSAGEHEMMAFSWLGTPFPFGGVEQIFGNGGGNNFAFSNIPELDPLIDSLATTIDEDERAAIANQIDVILWEYGHTLPLYQRPELVGQRSDLANFGAFGLQTPVIWTDVGYM